MRSSAGAQFKQPNIQSGVASWHSKKFILSVAKKSCERNRPIVRPLWSMLLVPGQRIEKVFSLWLPPGAIIEHEQNGPRSAVKP